MKRLFSLGITLCILFIAPTVTASESLNNPAIHRWILKYDRPATLDTITERFNPLSMDVIASTIVRLTLENPPPPELISPPVITYAFPEKPLQETVSSSQISLWNSAAQQNASVSALLRKINAGDTEISMAFIGNRNAADSLKERGLSVVEQNFTHADRYTKNDESARFYQATILDDEGKGSEGALFQALDWIGKQNVALIGIAVSNPSSKTVVQDILATYAEKPVIVQFVYDSQKEEHAGLFEQIIIEDPLPQHSSPAPVTPALYPVPTKSTQNEELHSTITLNALPADNPDHLLITVNTFHTPLSSPIVDAMVAVELQTPTGKIFSGSNKTNTNGVVQFSLKTALEPGEYRTTITNITHDTYKTTQQLPYAIFRLTK